MNIQLYVRRGTSDNINRSFVLIVKSAPTYNTWAQTRINRICNMSVPTWQSFKSTKRQIDTENTGPRAWSLGPSQWVNCVQGVIISRGHTSNLGRKKLTAVSVPLSLQYVCFHGLAHNLILRTEYMCVVFIATDEGLCPKARSCLIRLLSAGVKTHYDTNRHLNIKNQHF